MHFCSLPYSLLPGILKPTSTVVPFLYNLPPIILCFSIHSFLLIDFPHFTPTYSSPILPLLNPFHTSTHSSSQTMLFPQRITQLNSYPSFSLKTRHFFSLLYFLLFRFALLLAMPFQFSLRVLICLLSWMCYHVSSQV